MKSSTKIFLLLLVLCGACAASYQPALNAWRVRNRPNFREAEVEEGRIVFVVNSTGTVKPILEVHIGSVVSGPITELFVDFNDTVTEGQLLAKVDPRIYTASVNRDKATLLSREAEVLRVDAQLQQAKNDERRAEDLRGENAEYISDSEMDSFKYARIGLEAQLKLAESAVVQAQEILKNSETNLLYTDITSPVDGIVIDRKIDAGQTLAANFQTPELFIVAPEMDKRMYVFAAVDEADIGLIRRAKETQQPVHFEVDAYEDDLFEGVIYQIRTASTVTQNVVTYPVVIESPNSGMKLLPGMTADISFQIEVKENVIKIPRSALRFLPDRKYVHKDDHKILDGFEIKSDDDNGPTETMLSARETVEARRNRNRRHVWVVEGDVLRAVEVVTGLSDNKFSELVSGNLKKGQKLVTNILAKGQSL